MRTICALMTVLALSVAYGRLGAVEGDTEVKVETGTVRVVTEKGEATVEAGLRAELREGESPTVTVDDPLVKDLIELDRFVQAEKKAGRMRTDASTVQVIRLDNEDTWHTAVMLEMPEESLGKRYSRQDNTVEFGPTGLPRQFAFYDMKGRRLSLDTEKVTDTTALVRLQLKDEIPRGGTLKLVMVADFAVREFEQAGVGKVMWREGALWQVMAGNESAYNLNYYRVVLPASAIFVDSNLEPLSVDQVDGRLAVTFRNYTGEEAEGAFRVAFLWPEKDGTSLTDLPPEYRGFRDARDVKLSEEYQRQMQRIKAGLEYRDFSSPLCAVLTWNYAMVQEDEELYVTVRYGFAKDPSRKAKFLAEPEAEKWSSRGYFVERMDFLSSPPWPEKPEEGHLHPVYMCYPGTLMRRDMLACIYHEGKWLRIGNAGNPWDTDVSVFGKFR